METRAGDDVCVEPCSKLRASNRRLGTSTCTACATVRSHLNTNVLRDEQTGDKDKNEMEML